MKTEAGKGRVRKLVVTGVLEYDADLMHGADNEARLWFEELLLSSKLTIVESNEIGDEIGTLDIWSVNQTQEDKEA